MVDVQPNRPACNAAGRAVRILGGPGEPSSCRSGTSIGVTAGPDDRRVGRIAVLQDRRVDVVVRIDPMSRPVFEGVTLGELFLASAAAGGDRIALQDRGISYTWREYAERAGSLAARWGAWGVERQQPVALLLGNRPEFHVLDVSLMLAGAVPFSIDPDDPVERLAQLLDTARPPVMVTDTAHAGPALAAAAAGRHRPRIVVIDGAPTGTSALDELMATPAGPPPTPAVGPEDVATLIFTSGTTGTPKAVKLSHRAIALSLRNTDRLAPVGPGGQVLSYLPLTHIAERFMSHYLALAFGLTITSVAEPDRLYTEIERIRPSRFFSVPRVYEKLADRVRRAVIAPDLRAATDIGLAAVRATQNGHPLDEATTAALSGALATLAPLRAELGLDRTEFRGVPPRPPRRPCWNCWLPLGSRSATSGGCPKRSCAPSTRRRD